MDISTYASGMAAYNEWMNEKVYACAAALTDEQRKRDMDAFFGSVHGTLNHLYLGDEAWMQRVHGEPVTMKSPRDQPFAEFAELQLERRKLDARISRWAKDLPEAFASSELRVQSVTYRREIVLPGWAVVVQVFNHQTHHRGQLTTLLKQLGQDPGITDFPMMPQFVPSAG
jgi:uncharacterized damage-inducible protein DinB